MDKQVDDIAYMLIRLKDKGVNLVIITGRSMALKGRVIFKTMKIWMAFQYTGYIMMGRICFFFQEKRSRKFYK